MPDTLQPLSPALRAYQLEGVADTLDILKNRRAAALFDEPGLGKTAQALAVARARNARRKIVIGPAIARGAWAIELIKFAPELAGHFHIVAPDAVPADFDLDAPDLMLVFSYDTFSRPNIGRHWAVALMSRSWDLLVLDEAHYLRNETARTRAIYGVRGAHHGVQAVCARVLLLSGTPAPNHSGELWQHVRTFWPDLVPLTPTLEQFQERYTRYEDTIFGRQVRGSKLQDELRTKLAPVIVRRRRRDVLPELPPLQIEDTPLALDALSLSILEDLSYTEDNDDDGANLSRSRRLLGEAKLTPTVAWTEERLGSTGEHKIILFAWHRDLIRGLAARLGHHQPAVITGDTLSVARGREATRFQNDPNCRVLVGQLLAAGSAITLTAANHVAIVEPSWVPGENEQAIARAWRLGQQSPVLASFLYLPNTLDETIMRTFRRKASEVLTLMAREGTTQNAG